MPIDWTSEVPGSDGCYWARGRLEDPKPELIFVFAGAGDAFRLGVDRTVGLATFSHYYGPIEPPAGFEQSALTVPRRKAGISIWPATPGEKSIHMAFADLKISRVSEGQYMKWWIDGPREPGDPWMRWLLGAEGYTPGHEPAPKQLPPPTPRGDFDPPRRR